MRSDSPPPSWYEAPAWTTDAEAEVEANPDPGDQFVIAHGIVTWTAGHPDDD